MIRLFQQHKVRKQQELNQCWNFIANNGPHKGQIYKMLVPGAWENNPDFTHYRGKAKYETEVETGGNVRLIFKGVSHTANVYFDEAKVAHHYNAFTPFSTDIKHPHMQNVPYRQHKITVEVDNTFSEKSALHIPNDYYTYGGITRPVVLEELPNVYIEYVHVNTYKKEEKWCLEIKALIQNISKDSSTFHLSFHLGNRSVITKPYSIEYENSQLVTFKWIDLDVTEYDFSNPKLYLLETRLYCNNEANPTDDLIERIGFREIQVKGKQILVNNKNIYFKGFCRHEDHPMFGCSLPVEMMEYDLQLIKDMGGNAVRTTHYPNDERFLDLCDEYGIMVWEENHARGLSEEQMKNPNFELQCEDCIQEMISSHYNHPSIVIWGILNECASDTNYGRSCYEKQFKLIHMLDSTRPVSFASCRFYNDICLDLPDIVSYNIYPQWYLDTPVKEYMDGVYQWIQEKTGGSGKPFIISEVGAGGIYGYRSSTNAKWTEERQAEILENQLETILSYKDCTGIFIWQFCDCRVTEEEWDMRRPRTMNNKGIVDEFRRRKLSYSIVKRIFTEKK